MQLVQNDQDESGMVFFISCFLFKRKLDDQIPRLCECFGFTSNMFYGNDHKFMLFAGFFEFSITTLFDYYAQWSKVLFGLRDRLEKKR